MESIICIFKTFPININFTSIKTPKFSITGSWIQNSNSNNVLQMPTQDLLKTHHSTAVFFEMSHRPLKNNTSWKADCETNGVFFKSLLCSLNQVLSIRSLSKKPLMPNHSVHSWGWLNTGGEKSCSCFCKH